MNYLKINSGIYFFIFLLLTSCATSNYSVLNQSEGGAELKVTPDRVLLECEWLYDADDPTLYGFMIHVLDEENTVATVIQGNTLDKGSCEKRLKKIGKILKEGREVYIIATGSLRSNRTEEARSYSFPERGTYHSNGRVLQFMAITNELGSCFDAYFGDKKPCPHDP